MTVVFRIRTSGGQELSFASREMFEDFVRSGDLSPEDFVYDGETGSWSPARTHPVVLDLQYELEAAAEEGRGGSGTTGTDQATTEGQAKEATAVDGSATDSAEDDPSTPDPEDRPIGGPGLDFDLALTDKLTPEDEQRAFLEQLEAEREGDMDAGLSIRDSLADFTSDTIAPRHDPPPPRAPDPPPQPSRPEPRRTSGSERGRSPASRGRTGSPSTAAGRPETGSSSGGSKRALVLLLLAVLLGGGAYVGYQFLNQESGPADPGSEAPEASATDGDAPEARVPAPTLPEADQARSEVDPAPSEGDPAEPGADTEGAVDDAEPVLEAVIPDTPGAVLERAQERYLGSTQAELRGLQPVPDVWPSGAYLTAPSDHPEVVDVWQDYRSTIGAVRQRDATRYRTAYEAALDDAAVTGDARQERLDSAVADFAVSQELRDAHFDRVEALATAAIQSHNALVEAEGLLLYDATGSTGRSAGIGQGTSGRNAEAQLLLDQVIELLEGALDADGEGPGSGENVREWVWDGFLDAVTGQ